MGCAISNAAACTLSAFDALPPAMRVRAFGVDYARLTPPEGGELFITRYGWPMLGELLPAHWYPDQQLSPQARRMDNGTGAVYRLSSDQADGGRADLVIKFSRFAQEVPLAAGTTFPEGLWHQLMARARFNSPFEEFGLLMKLRRTNERSARRLLTKRPLAIYSPPQRFAAWQLGRMAGEFALHEHRLRQDHTGADAPAAPAMDAAREYILLFGWVKGMDAQQMHERGLLTDDQMRSLSLRVAEDLRHRGFQVLDNKPKHFILRPSRRTGQLLRRNGELVYALIDFELLVEMKDGAKSEASASDAAVGAKT